MDRERLRKLHYKLSKDLSNEVSLADTMKFGKYVGKTVSEVIENDVDYIVWCISKGIFDPDWEVEDAIKSKCPEECNEVDPDGFVPF